jgi:hypothetical protein
VSVESKGMLFEFLLRDKTSLPNVYSSYKLPRLLLCTFVFLVRDKFIPFNRVLLIPGEG